MYTEAFLKEIEDSLPLETVLRSYGFKNVRDYREKWTLQDGFSIIIDHKLFNSFSRPEFKGAGALQLIRLLEGNGVSSLCDFPKAVQLAAELSQKILPEEMSYFHDEKKSKVPFALTRRVDSPELKEKVFNYYIEQRRIPHDVLDSLYAQNKFFVAYGKKDPDAIKADWPMAVFPHQKDVSGEICAAERQYIPVAGEKLEKRIIAGSDKKETAWTIKGTSEDCIIFESHINLMSWLAMNPNTNDTLLSLGGCLILNLPFKNHFKRYFLGFDKDDTGNDYVAAAIQTYGEHKCVIMQPPAGDWNDFYKASSGHTIPGKATAAQLLLLQHLQKNQDFTALTCVEAENAIKKFYQNNMKGEAMGITLATDEQRAKLTDLVKSGKIDKLPVEQWKNLNSSEAAYMLEYADKWENLKKNSTASLLEYVRGVIQHSPATNEQKAEITDLVRAGKIDKLPVEQWKNLTIEKAGKILFVFSSNTQHTVEQNTVDGITPRQKEFMENLIESGTLAKNSLQNLENLSKDEAKKIISFALNQERDAAMEHKPASDAQYDKISNLVNDGFLKPVPINVYKTMNMKEASDFIASGLASKRTVTPATDKQRGLMEQLVHEGVIPPFPRDVWADLNQQDVHAALSKANSLPSTDVKNTVYEPEHASNSKQTATDEQKEKLTDLVRAGKIVKLPIEQWKALTFVQAEEIIQKAFKQNKQDIKTPDSKVIRQGKPAGNTYRV